MKTFFIIYYLVFVFWLLYILIQAIRNERVYKFRRLLAEKAYTVSLIKNELWGFEEIRLVSYSRMVKKWWRPCSSFYSKELLGKWHATQIHLSKLSPALLRPRRRYPSHQPLPLFPWDVWSWLPYLWHLCTQGARQDRTPLNSIKIQHKYWRCYWSLACG